MAGVRTLSFTVADLIGGIELPRNRATQAWDGRELPHGLSIVVPDNHWSFTDDIFYESVPSHLKDRVPRVWRDETGNIKWALKGEPLLGPAFEEELASFEMVPGCTEMEPRLRDLDAEGISKEIVFGNVIGAFYGYPDTEAREWIFRVYNEYMAEVGREAPGRFHGVGLINYWDMDKVEDSIRELKDLGFKTFLLPITPRGEGGASINYADPGMEPLWNAIDNSGLPICFHPGEIFVDGPGGIGTRLLLNFAPFRKNFGELIFGGIFDRHPDLRVVFAEADLNWVPGAIQTAQMAYHCYRSLLVPQIEHDPEVYWHRNCYATFQFDPSGLALIDNIGADRVMWSSDYPHPESTLGFGWKAIGAVMDSVSSDDASLILGKTASKVFNLG
jgi:predicted TIM-barrel fold metal-dependent hydrolase